MASARSILSFSKLCNINTFARLSEVGRPENAIYLVSVRTTTTKHFNPKYKWHRAKKFIPVDLPDFHAKGGNKMEKMRTKLKEAGILPRYWRERPMTITTAYEIIEPYQPPKGDGKASFLSKEKVSSLTTAPKDKVLTMTAIRKIKSYDSTFDVKMFPQIAHDLYVKAHTVLMKKDAEELSLYVTEKANLEMLSSLKYQTLHWKFIESLEPPVVVHVRAGEVLTKSNLFAQVTVRFHTKQCLAIYDRFGRLHYGSEILAKDVLEYVVFEKHINNEYGVWRVHGKIIPNWMETPSPSARTYRQEEEVIEDDMDDFVEEDYISESSPKTEIVEKESEAKESS